MKKKNYKILMSILTLLICIGLGTIFILSRYVKSNTNNGNVIDLVNQPRNNYEGKYIFSAYDINKAINEDYVGDIKFQSGLIDLPFVQAKVETTIIDAYEKYLRTDWETMEHDEEGSIFLDPNNILNDQNLVIYGHYVYPSYDASGTHKFTPLHALKNQDNYEENKYIDLELEDEIRTYEIAHVYYSKIDDNGNLEDGMEYMKSNFSDEELQYYLNRVEEEEFYHTDVEIGSNDKFLTLQTCVENRDDLKLIVIAKLIETKGY